jgi:hypothetical protein
MSTGTGGSDAERGPGEWIPVGDVFMSLEKGRDYEVLAKFNYVWTITHVRPAASKVGLPEG